MFLQQHLLQAVAFCSPVTFAIHSTARAEPVSLQHTVRLAHRELPLLGNLYSLYRTMDTARTTHPTEPLSQPRRGLFL